MHKNYYLFKKLIDEINPGISGSYVKSVFTVHKDELIFDLQKNEENFYLILNLSKNFPFILKSKATDFKSARFFMFEELSGCALYKASVAINNKLVTFDFGEYRINAFFYGARPNIFLFNGNEKCIDSFKTMKEENLPEIPAESNVDLSPELIENLVAASPKSTFPDIIKSVSPACNKRMMDELSFRMNMAEKDKVKNIPDISVFNAVLNLFFMEIDEGKCYIHRKEPNKKCLLLYRSKKLLEEKYEVEEFDSINKGWTIFTREIQYENSFGQLQRQISTAVARRKKVLETALEKIADADVIEERKRIADLKGNLIITNKHKIPRGAQSVELVNIFSDTQEKITIKLNPKKKAVENAQHYFQKYKNISEKKTVLNIKRDIYNQELNELKEIETKLETESLKDLAKIQQQLIDMNLIQEESPGKETLESLKYSFKRVILENTWDIYIGKNGVNNDLLTFSFAQKWDIWMHAQGVTGSHVIIKTSGKDVNVPISVIEQAAQITAANSKAKHSGMVPVIYTQTRFVSRVRNAPPGTVSVKNEKVIFVKPLNLN